MTWKQLLKSFSTQPTKTHQQQREQATTFACVSILFSPVIWDKGLLITLTAHHAAQQLLLQDLPPAQWTSTSDQGLDLQYDDLGMALEAALSVHSVLIPQRLQAMIGVGYGDGIVISKEGKSIEMLRAKRVTHFLQPQEIALTERAKNNIELPLGVGGFTAPRNLQSFAGVPFWMVKDYR